MADDSVRRDISGKFAPIKKSRRGDGLKKFNSDMKKETCMVDHDYDEHEEGFFV